MTESALSTSALAARTSKQFGSFRSPTSLATYPDPFGTRPITATRRSLVGKSATVPSALPPNEEQDSALNVVDTRKRYLTGEADKLHLRFSAMTFRSMGQGCQRYENFTNSCRPSRASSSLRTISVVPSSFSTSCRLLSLLL